MKKEVTYFRIENSYGGNQSWFLDPFMKLGGCAAAAACDTCINLAKHHQKINLFPFSLNPIKKEEYIQFSTMMKSFLRPRIGGITSLNVFVKGFEKYIASRGRTGILVSAFAGERGLKDAIEIIRYQIDQDLVIPYLLLRHKRSHFHHYVWHWFLIVGYEEKEDGFFVKVATYGNYRWLSLAELWASGYRKKGGMIIIE